MRVFHGFDLSSVLHKPVVTVGSFDGVHVGHRQLLNIVKQHAQRTGGESVVVTFANHPRTFLHADDGLRLLSTQEEKIWLLGREGIDCLVIVQFDEAFRRLSPEEFVRGLLIDKLGAEELVVGYNHRFGHNHTGNYNLLDKMQQDYGIRVSRLLRQEVEGEKVSSTVVRDAIVAGDMSRASKLLGHPYLLIGDLDTEGVVRCGDPLKLLPPPGNYPVRFPENGMSAKGTLHVSDEGILRLEQRDVPSGHVGIEFLGE